MTGDNLEQIANLPPHGHSAPVSRHLRPKDEARVEHHTLCDPA